MDPLSTSSSLLKAMLLFSAPVPAQAFQGYVELLKIGSMTALVENSLSEVCRGTYSTSFASSLGPELLRSLHWEI